MLALLHLRFQRVDLLPRCPSEIAMVQLLKVGLAVMVYMVLMSSCRTMPVALGMCLLLHRLVPGLFIHLDLHLDLHHCLVNSGPHGHLALSPSHGHRM